MLRYGTAALFAAFILAWPGYAGSDTDTFWSTPSAAVLAAAELSAPVPEDVPGRPEIVPPPVAQVSQPVAPAPPIDKHLIIENDTASIGPTEPYIAPITPSPAVALPFGLTVTPVSFGEIVTKWDGAEAKIRADNDVLSRCDSDPQHCPKAAQLFRNIIAQGRARSGLGRIGTINRAVNLAIEPESDMEQWGVPDRWSNPLETFATGRGDCEDYAIAKFVALTAAGVPANDVKLVIVRNTAADEDHAVVAVRNGGNWIILDNRWLTMVKDAEMAKAVPLFVLDDSGVRAFAAPVLTVARAAAAPASTPF